MARPVGAGGPERSRHERSFSGHWEDFFIPRDRPPQNILLLDVNGYVADAEAALAGAPADAPLLVDGAAIPGRHVLIQPGSHLVVPPAP